MSRKRKWLEGTDWAMIGLPITIAAKMRVKYDLKLKDAIVACLKEATQDMEWPEENK